LSVRRSPSPTYTFIEHDSIGHFIDDDFSRDGGSLQPHRDPSTKKPSLGLVEDISYGEEPSFTYGADFWHDKLLQLLPQSRLACIRKYKFASDHLLSPGLGQDGHSVTTPLPLPNLTALERRLAPRAPTTRQTESSLPATRIQGTSPLTATTESQAAVTNLYVKPASSPWNYGTKEYPRSACSRSRSHLMRVTNWDWEIWLLEWALCRMNDSHLPGLRTHPMLVVPPPPVPLWHLTQSCR